MIVVADPPSWLPQQPRRKSIHSTSYYTLHIFRKWNGHNFLRCIWLCNQLQGVTANEKPAIRTSLGDLGIICLPKRNSTVSSDKCIFLDFNDVTCGSVISCEPMAAAHAPFCTADFRCPTIRLVFELARSYQPIPTYKCWRSLPSPVRQSLME